MRAAAALESWAARLAHAGVPDARLSARYCLALAVGGKTLPAADAALGRAARLSAEQARHFDALCARRLRREPLQYILGDWDFDVLRDVRVRPPVLIPRPETEELVGLAAAAVDALLARASDARVAAGDGGHHEQLLAAALLRGGTPLQLQPQQPVRLLEVGTGSGVVSIALCRRFPPPRLRCVAIDVAPHAVALAAENRAAQGVCASQLAVELLSFEQLPCQLLGGAGGSAGGGEGPGATLLHRAHLLVSNPPYVPDADLPGLAPEVADWEDPAALAGGAPGGLGFILRLLCRVAEARTLLPGGLALLETDPSHPALLAALLPRGVAAAGDDGGVDAACAAHPAAGSGCTAHGTYALHPASAFGVPAAARLPPVRTAQLGERERAALDGWCAGAGARALGTLRQWRLLAAFSDHAQRERFVALQWLPPGPGPL